MTQGPSGGPSGGLSGRLSGKRALVTGAGRGIGAAIAHALAAEGAMVLITDIDATAAAAAAEAIPGALACRLDVTSAEDWRDAIALAREAMGGLSVLVNNAGIGAGDGSFDKVSPEQWRRIFAVNLDGAFLGCQIALPLLRESGGGGGVSGGASIVNIASSAALHARADMTAYGASKAALWSLTRSVALQCAQAGWGIRCNAVLPAYVETDLIDAFRPSDVPRAKISARLARQVPLGRIASPQEIAAGVVYLASDESRFMTGAELKLDGGLGAL